jgi:Ca2+-transporting ATPase
MSEVLSIFIATMLGFVILKPVHLLWINLITDSFPALALGTEAAESDLMQRPPRDPNDGVFSGGVGFDVAYQGFFVTLLTLAAYFIGERIQNGVWAIADSTDGMTMAFLTLSMAQIFHSFNMRSQRQSVFSLKRQNLYLWGAASLSLVLTLVVLYVPFLQEAFSFEHISFFEYGIALVLAFMIIPLVEIVKAIQRGVAKRK